MMLREWIADATAYLSALCVIRAERLRGLAIRWNARASWLSDVAEWLGTHKTWADIRGRR